MTTEIGIKMLKRHEGYNDTVFRDQMDNLIVGFGHKVDAEDMLKEGEQIDAKRAEELFKMDLHNTIEDAKQKYFGVWERMNPTRKDVLINMIFQLGTHFGKDLHGFHAAIFKEDYQKAAERMLKSDWAKITPNRAKELAELMRVGHYRNE